VAVYPFISLIVPHLACTGVPHTYQLTSMLTLPEVNMVLPQRRLRVRTYRAGAGNCVSLGGLARIEIVSTPTATIYLNVFVSDEIVTHLGKAENAEALRAQHTGGLLVPPLSPARLQELGPLQPRDVVVDGNSWTRSSRDVAIAGLGWVGVGLVGSATLRVWVPPAVAVTVHEALIPDMAKVFERPGFSSMLPKAQQRDSSKGGLKRGATSSGKRR